MTVPRAGWLAVGSVLAALAATCAPALLAGDEPNVVMLGPAAVIAAAVALACAATAVWRPSVPALAVAAGAGIVAARLVAGTLLPTPTPAILPAALDHAAAEVVSVSAPSDGAQRVVLAVIDAAGDPLRRSPPACRATRRSCRGTVSRSAAPCAPRPMGPGSGTTCGARGLPERSRPEASIACRSRRGPRRGWSAADVTRERCWRAYCPPQAGLAAGILVGLRDQVDRDVAAAFTTAGLSHIVAISGWNIAVVAGALAAILRRTSVTTR